MQPFFLQNNFVFIVCIPKIFFIFVENKNKEIMQALKLKFKRDAEYTGRYAAEGEYRGYQVRVEIAKYEQGGFNYTTYLNGRLADSYGYAGLRKAEILATIDENTMADIDEKIRYRNL